MPALPGLTDGRPSHLPRVDVAVFGGSGFYAFEDHLTPTPVDTPYGPPSAPPMVGEIGGRRVAFLPRHGHGHEIPAHRVDYRANVWTFAALGARAVIAPFACGALRADLERGDLVVVDQLVDRTFSRVGTFFDGPVTHHVPFADPYDARLRADLLAAAGDLGLRAHDGGTVVAIDGPRFSSRAESRWHASMGWDVVNMTQAPEAALAAEAGLRYAAVGLVTDHDAGVEGDPTIAPVTEEEVFGYLAANADAMRRLLHLAIPRFALDAAHD